MEDNRTEIEKLNEWGLSINANISFGKFIKAATEEKGLNDAICKVYKIIDDIVMRKEYKQFTKILQGGTKIYRARLINNIDDESIACGVGVTDDGKFIGYNENNSREPLIGISGPGRNNVAGATYLYAASNPETACMEIKSQFSDVISLATFELNEPMEIIDFATDKSFQREDTELYGMSLGIFFSKLMLRFGEPVRNEKDYRATQIIADYLRKTGIDGIAYISFLSPGGCNYTFFNCHPSKLKFCESKIVIHKQANHSFWDLNDEKEIMSNKSGKMLAYDKKIADEQKEQLRRALKQYDLK